MQTVLLNDKTMKGSSLLTERTSGTHSVHAEQVYILQEIHDTGVIRICYASTLTGINIKTC